ncbi:MAG TPA: DUF4291 domain-containing protein [Humisphaera sp.]
MTLELEQHETQKARWPRTGRHILAQFDADSVVVYQAYRPEVGRWAVDHQQFGGPWSFNRMSWVKPNFLWMMYRSGWGTKPDQEVTLAVRLRRPAFDAILAAAVHSSFAPHAYPTEAAWTAAVADSEVRLQWDPDHSPAGGPLERRAIQLGLRGDVLRRYATEWVVSIEDVCNMVAEQRENRSSPERLLTPRERVYPVADPDVRRRLGIDTFIERQEEPAVTP